MKVGFTGTRDGMTPSQEARLLQSLALMDATEFHHGDCVGADEQAHLIATALGIRTISHPPSDPRLRAFCDADEERAPRPYLERNRAIVDETDTMLATPSSAIEERRSGTWSTIRYAAKIGRSVGVIVPKAPDEV